MAEGPPSPKRTRLDTADLAELSKDELISRLKDQDKYIRQLEDRRASNKEDGEDSQLKELEGKLKKQTREAVRREGTLVHRLATKEQELQDYINQIQEMKQAQSQNSAQLRSMLLDPAVNLVFQRMSKEMDEYQEKLKQTQNELSAWKFTPDSQTGKRLMAKCRMLLQENEELGKVINAGRTAQLEGEIALQKTLVQEMKNNQSELDDLLGDLDEDVEGMQSMIFVLQQQLKETKEQLTKVQEENQYLKSCSNPAKTSPHISPKCSPHRETVKEESEGEQEQTPFGRYTSDQCEDTPVLNHEEMDTSVDDKVNDDSSSAVVSSVVEQNHVDTTEQSRTECCDSLEEANNWSQKHRDTTPDKWSENEFKTDLHNGVNRTTETEVTGEA